MNEKQKERDQRGRDFEEELRKSWLLVPNCWRFKLPDGRGGTRPGDSIVLLEEANILLEAKRTAGDSFNLGMIRPDQFTGLLDFDRVVSRNYGLVFVSFDSDHLQEAYAFRLTTALAYMKKNRYKNIKHFIFRSNIVPAVPLPIITLPDGSRGYDLREVGPSCCIL